MINSVREQGNPSDTARPHTHLSKHGECQIWQQNVLESPQIEHIWDFSDLILVHFGSVSQSVLKPHLKKAQFFPIWYQSDSLRGHS